MPRRFVDEFSLEQIEAAEDSYVDMESIQDGMDQSLDTPVDIADPMAVPGGAGQQEPGMGL
jgi:hypothetical protein